MADSVTIPADIAEHFTDTWCGALGFDIGPRLNCAEVETLAELLRALGAEQAADEWVGAHAEGDSPGDDHFEGTVPAEASLTADGARWIPDTTDTQEQKS
ncbi:hypothetical protein WB388_08765 [Streptomyces brasiliscabiei]|uniref:Uncharacterized protein n=1 Tax=Streptomyces brasiliscabiei TaxID=2736302 RepID=A0ABU8G9V5_9ACTN